MTSKPRRTVSASKLEAWKRCKVRYAFNYIERVQEPFALAAQAGVETHKVLENQGPWDKTFDKYAVGWMAQLLQNATPPGVTAREERFETELYGVPFVGVIDFHGEDLVGDYKTTSNKRNVKSPEVLLTDPQRLLYTQVRPSARRTLWLYGDWKTMSVTPRESEIQRAADVERFKLHVLQPAEEILALPEETPALSLTKNLSACMLFPPAGCPYKDRCFPSTKKFEVNVMGKLLDRVKQIQKSADTEPAAEPAVAEPAAAEPAAAEPAVAESAVAEPEAGNPRSTLGGWGESPVSASGREPSAAAARTNAEPSSDIMAAIHEAASDLHKAALAAEKRNVHVRKTAEPAVTEPAVETKKRGRKLKQTPTLAEPAAESAAAEPAAESAAEFEERGHAGLNFRVYPFPRLSRTVAAEPAAAEPVAAEPTAAEPTAAEPALAEHTAPDPQARIDTLYVDCLPIGEPVFPAASLISAACGLVCSELGVPHIGLVDFAKGGPSMAAALDSQLYSRGPLYYKSVYLETKSAESKAALLVLQKHASRVVKGVF